MVSVGRSVVGERIDVVRVLDSAGVSLGVHHLVELGHVRIVYVDAGHGPAAKYRREGYVHAMQAAGLADEVLVLRSGRSRALIDRTAEAIRTLEPNPTAVVTSDDAFAVGLVESLGRIGIAVPNQMSVLGYDDSPVARMPHVELSTVEPEPCRAGAGGAHGSHGTSARRAVGAG